MYSFSRLHAGACMWGTRWLRQLICELTYWKKHVLFRIPGIALTFNINTKTLGLAQICRANCIKMLVCSESGASLTVVLGDNGKHSVLWRSTFVPFSGPLTYEDTPCATTCVPSSKFAYETGSTYRYSYEADTVTSLAGVAEEHSALHLRTTADVHVLSPCELVLTVSCMHHSLSSIISLGMPCTTVLKHWINCKNSCKLWPTL